MTRQISELPANTNPQDTDLLASKQGSEDRRISLDQISDHTIDKIDDDFIFDAVLRKDSNSSTLNANFLQGLTAAYFRNATNLNAGTVPDSRLPSGSLDEYVDISSARRSRNVLKFHSSIFGANLMVQFGYTGQYSVNTIISVTYPEPFTSGFGTSNHPIVMLTPECTADGGGNPSEFIELDARLYSVTNSDFAAATTRTSGKGPDSCAAHYIAIGKY